MATSEKWTGGAGDNDITDVGNWHNADTPDTGDSAHWPAMAADSNKTCRWRHYIARPNAVCPDEPPRWYPVRMKE